MTLLYRGAMIRIGGRIALHGMLYMVCFICISEKKGKGVGKFRV